MKVIVSFFLIISSLFIGKFIFTPAENITSAQETAPAYAKWGTLAVQKVMEKYPNAKIVDYLHVGREVGNTNSIEKFKLWLKEDSREFGVFVDITFNNQTETIVDIKYTETSK